MKRRTALMIMGGAAAGLAGFVRGASAEQRRDLFAQGNLMAWCIVPYDAKQRGPEERAAMLQRLAISRLAYDWREEHLPTLDRELDALQKRGISLNAFWFPCGMEPEKEEHVRLILDFVRRRGVKTQLWLALGVPEEGTTQEQRVEIAVKPIGYVAREAERLGCKVALYNHGGWFGEPENQIAIIERLKRPNVGIAYNFHHGHTHIDRFPAMMTAMKPHLLALNINGMRKEGPKILPVGQGDRELEMLQAVLKSGYKGLIGILNHRPEMDAEVALRENLEGLQQLKKKLL